MQEISALLEAASKITLSSPCAVRKRSRKSPNPRFPCSHCNRNEFKSSAELKSHYKEAHGKHVIVSGVKFTRNNRGFFHCPGCNVSFKSRSNMAKSHSGCIGSLPPVDLSDPANIAEFEKFLDDNDVHKSADGDFLVCTKHGCILSKHFFSKQLFHICRRQIC